MEWDSGWHAEHTTGGWPNANAGKYRGRYFLAQHGFEVAGIDYAAAAIELGRKRVHNANVDFFGDDLRHLQLLWQNLAVAVESGDQIARGLARQSTSTRLTRKSLGSSRQASHNQRQYLLDKILGGFPPFLLAPLHDCAIDGPTGNHGGLVE